MGKQYFSFSFFFLTIRTTVIRDVGKKEPAGGLALRTILFQGFFTAPVLTPSQKPRLRVCAQTWQFGSEPHNLCQIQTDRTTHQSQNQLSFPQSNHSSPERRKGWDKGEGTRKDHPPIRPAAGKRFFSLGICVSAYVFVLSRCLFLRS